MEGELYNLWPVVGSVNGMRSNYRYSTVRLTALFQGCALSIDKIHRQVELDNKAKGVVARANLLMRAHFAIRLSPAQTKLFNAWNQLFPPTAWECTLAKQIKEYQGYDNPFIRRYCSQVMAINETFQGSYLLIKNSTP